MSHRYAVVCHYRPGCGVFHRESSSKTEAETSLSQLRERLRLQKKEGILKQADIYQLSQDCQYTFHTGFSNDLYEVILIDGNIFHALITDDIGESGNRLGSFQMTLAHAKTRPDIYPWATDL